MPRTNPPLLPPQPTLHTPRLLLRPFRAEDAPALVAALGDPDVARNTLNVPHPYPPARAEAFLAALPRRHIAGQGIVWAIVAGGGDDGALVGAMGLDLVLAHRCGELGYWVAKARWGQGIATEAGAAVVAYGMRVLGLHRIEARHYPENPASGAVLRKLGLRHEGRLREAVWRDGVARDLEVYGILAHELAAG